MSLLRSSMSATKAASRSLDWRAAWAIAWALGLLLLSTPGVRVVQASDEIASAERGQTCEAWGSNVVNVTMEFTLKRRNEPGSDELSYGLDNSGFNYRPEPAPRSVAPRHNPVSR